MVIRERISGALLMHSKIGRQFWSSFFTIVKIFAIATVSLLVDHIHEPLHLVVAQGQHMTRVYFSHMVKVLNLLAVFSVTLQACGPRVAEPLTQESVREQLNVAYALSDRGQFAGSDSVYKFLLAHQVSSEDSVRISGSYIQVLLELKDYQGAFLHVDRAFPLGLGPKDELRRHSFRQQAFFGLEDCEGIKAEQAALLALVKEHTGLQLSLEDVATNGEVVAKRCP